ncbi:histidine kinase [Pelagicoccus sp. SDUM812005]|uniref:histidine kinase n=1 Tax=Pelagicoccus sp. SDUM812005 TaxID=3041257 RepID=UPI00280FA309|nr:histidine kinase [Pelagicoccus sp. SDUM812005]MDQ8179548.1 histidine kinase [Pelagicoccus sp. SDUM812005]
MPFPFFKYSTVCCCLLLAIACAITLGRDGHAQQQSQSLSQLEELSGSELEARLAEINFQLANLASFSLRGGTGAIGYRSYWRSPTEWVEIKLERSYPLDEIVLVPCLWRHPEKGFLADAFPRKLRVIAGNGPDDPGSEIASFEQPAGASQGIDPLVLHLPPTEANWIRIEALELSERNFDGLKVLQLAEVMVFSGEENVALHRPVTCSSTDRRGVAGVWHERFLVDGFLPYLMDASQGTRSNAFIAFADGDSHITLDLGEPQLISRFRLHAVDQSDTVPQAYPGDLGIPDRIRFEGALRADFSDASLLLDYRKGGMLETGPTIIQQFPATLCRYVRLIPLPPSLEDFAPIRIGFSEIEILSEGKNVALNAPVSSYGLRSGHRSPSALTDGNNLYGEILSMRDWMNQLAQRGTLERELPIVQAALTRHYERQKKLLARMFQLVLVLVVLIAFVILIDRHLRLQKVSQIRERIAADLHDELGANIHTIGLISDIAKNSLDSRSETEALLDEIRAYSEKSGEAARYCTNILEARGVCENLVEEMSQFANRSLADLEHEFHVEGEDIIKDLPTHTRIDLLLFYKECLTNILRHSGASKVKTRLLADPKAISMIVSDNGIGLEASNQEETPKSLKRRAKLLKASIKSERSVTGGTRVTLILKTRKFRFFK